MRRSTPDPPVDVVTTDVLLAVWSGAISFSHWDGKVQPGSNGSTCAVGLLALFTIGAAALEETVTWIVICVNAPTSSPLPPSWHVTWAPGAADAGPHVQPFEAVASMNVTSSDSVSVTVTGLF